MVTATAPVPLENATVAVAGAAGALTARASVAAAAAVEFGGFDRPTKRHPGHAKPLGEWALPTGVGPDPNSRYQDDFMIPLAATDDDPERKAAQGDTSHLFEDTQNDLASFPKTDKVRAKEASNHRALDFQRTGTARTGPDTALSRQVGTNTCAWATRTTKPMRRLSSEAIPFGSSSHLETSRLM
jgi:hypothetical protein